MERSKQRRQASSRRSLEERRQAEIAALNVAVTAYDSALEMVAKAAQSLVRGARALDLARATAVSPDLVQYGLVAGFRPADVQRVVHGVARDLQAKIAFARSSDLVVPDGTEEAYGRLVSSLTSASEMVSRALEEFGEAVPRGSAKPHPVIRDIIMSASRAASLLNRLVGKGRTAASVHALAVRDEITSEKTVSFY